MRQQLTSRMGLFVLGTLLVFAACAPSAVSPSAPAVAPAAPKQPAAPAPAAAPQAPVAAPTAAPTKVPAPAPKPSGAPKHGGTLRLVSDVEITSLDPVLNSSRRLSIKVNAVYERLLRYKTGPGVDPAENILEPGLAESWKISEDGKQFTFNLRKGVKWQNLPPVNGRELVADDVVFSINHNKQFSPSLSTFFESMERVEAVDKYTVRITLKEPSASIETLLGDSGTASGAIMIAREVVEADGDLKKRVVGTGPFIMTKYVASVVTELKRNPNYWEPGIPYLDGYVVYTIPDASAVLSALRAGQLDLVTQDAISGKRDVANVKRTRPDLQEFKYLSPTYRQYWFRTDKAPWNNVKLRQAFSVAMNRQADIDTFWDGEGISLTVFPAPWPPYSLSLEELGEKAKFWRYDLKFAKQLLAEAGYPNGVDVGDQLIHTAVERWPDRTLLYNDGWQQAGIRFNIKTITATELLAKVYRGDHEGASGAGGTIGPDPSNFLKARLSLKSVFNSSHVNDPLLEKMIDEQDRIIDPKKRIQALKEIQLYLADKVYYAGVTVGYSYHLASPEVRNYYPHAQFGDIADQTKYIWIDK